MITAVKGSLGTRSRGPYRARGSLKYTTSRPAGINSSQLKYLCSVAGISHKALGLDPAGFVLVITEVIMLIYKEIFMVDLRLEKKFVSTKTESIIVSKLLQN